MNRLKNTKRKVQRTIHRKMNNEWDQKVENLKITR